MSIRGAHTTPLFKTLQWILIYVSCTVGVVLLINRVQQYWYGRDFQISASFISNAPKILISNADFVYDLSGSEAYGEGNPMNLFDESCDPKKNNLFIPVTQPLPIRGGRIYFQKGRGLRIVVDLRAHHQLKEIYWYDRSLSSDTIWVYTGTPKKWKQNLQYVTNGVAGGWGWKSIAVNDTSRFLMIRFNHPGAILTALVAYGRPLEPLPKQVYVEQKDQTKTLKTLREFAGSNSYDYVPSTLSEPFHQIRLYQQLEWYDNDTVNAYPKNEISLNYFNLPAQQQIRFWGDSLQKKGNRLWMSVFGQPRYLSKGGHKEKDKPVTMEGMDTEEPMSYARHANVFWNLAAVYGAQKVDTGLLKIKERPRVSALNIFQVYENGNEEDAYWVKEYWTPLEYFALSSADYDGHEGKLGRQHGIKNADSNALLITSGMVQLDTNRVKTLKFLCEQLRNDQQFLWQGGVQYHYYCNANTNKSQLPIEGISPEKDRLREKLTKIKAFHNRLLPGVPVFLGENGYDRNQQSWQRTPLLQGMDAETSQGIMLVRSLMAAFFSGIDGYYQYMIRNATNDENATGAYATSGMIGGPDQQNVYKAWYYWKNCMTVLGDYLPDKIVSENGNVWVYRLRHCQNEKKQAYFIVAVNSTENANKNFSLNSRSYNNQHFKKIDIFQKTVLQTDVKLVNNRILIVAEETPTIVLVEKN